MNDLSLISIPAPESEKELELELNQIQKLLQNGDVGQIYPFSVSFISSLKYSLLYVF